MKKRKLFRGTPESFKEIYWIQGYTPKEIIMYAAQNEIVCVCCIESTPIESSVWFFDKTKYLA